MPRFAIENSDGTLIRDYCSKCVIRLKTDLSCAILINKRYSYEDAVQEVRLRCNNCGKELTREDD